ncbi:MAG: magnesium transporter [Thermomicrobiales bacterium]
MVETRPAPVVATLLGDLREAVARGDPDLARSLAARMLEEDALALLEDLQPAELSRLFAILGDESLAQLLARLDDRDAAGILSRMTAAQAADILEEIDPDDATDILEEVDPDLLEGLLVAMEPDEAAELRDLMGYPPESAGGIMTPAFVAISPELRADQAVVALRRVAEEAETVNYVYVVDREEHLLGVLSLHALVLTRPTTLVRDLMIRDIITVPVLADQEDAARILTDRDLLALPVVDLEGRLVGIITADDVADVIEAETTEDIERLGGSQPLSEPYLRASPFLLFRKRVVWLFVLFLAQFITIEVYSSYEGDINRAAVLSILVPILIGTGGNVGSQTVSTIIRAMAVGEAEPRHILRILRKELITGLGLGLAMGALMYGRGYYMDQNDVDPTALALTVASTVLILTVWAAAVATVLPITLSKLRVDPAVVSAPFITSIIDATGVMIYFTIARALLF